MLKKYSEDLNSIKKIQSGTKGILIKKRTIYREMTVESFEVENQINDWNIRKQKTKIRTTRILLIETPLGSLVLSSFGRQPRLWLGWAWGRGQKQIQQSVRGKDVFNKLFQRT